MSLIQRLQNEARECAGNLRREGRRRSRYKVHISYVEDYRDFDPGIEDVRVRLIHHRGC